jgi:hypothetical protein
MTKSRMDVRMIGAMALTTILFAGSQGLTEETMKPGDQAATCVQWKSEVKYSGFGYNHLVHLDNQCDYVAVCHVTTNVNPKGVHETLKPKEKKTVLTMRGSAAREFKAQVSCKKK